MRRLLLTLVLSLLSVSAFAAVTPNSPVTPQTPNRGIVQFLQGTDTAGTYKTLYTGGTNGSIVNGIYATTNDNTAAHLVTCQIVNTAVKYGGTAVTVGGGTVGANGFANGVPPINLMSPVLWPGLPIDQNGNPYIFLASSSDTLQCTFATSLTTTDVINLVAVAADF